MKYSGWKKSRKQQKPKKPGSKWKDGNDTSIENELTREKINENHKNR